jgi:hypothetical protein
VDPVQAVLKPLVVTALLAAGCQVYTVSPLACFRYRDRRATSGAKSDLADAKARADLVRSDQHNHRQVAGDCDLAEAARVLVRTTSRRSGRGSGRSTRCGRRCASTTQPPSRRPAPDLPPSDAVAVRSIAQPRTPDGHCPGARSLPCCAGPVGRATSTSRPARSRVCCARAICTPRQPSQCLSAGGPLGDPAHRDLYRRDRRTRNGAVGAFEQHSDAKIERSLPDLATIPGRLGAGRVR